MQTIANAAHPRAKAPGLHSRDAASANLPKLCNMRCPLLSEPLDSDVSSRTASKFRGAYGTMLRIDLERVLCQTWPTVKAVPQYSQRSAPSICEFRARGPDSPAAAAPFNQAFPPTPLLGFSTEARRDH